MRITDYLGLTYPAAAPQPSPVPLFLAALVLIAVALWSALYPGVSAGEEIVVSLFGSGLGAAVGIFLQRLRHRNDGAIPPG